MGRLSGMSVGRLSPPADVSWVESRWTCDDPCPLATDVLRVLLICCWHPCDPSDGTVSPPLLSPLSSLKVLSELALARPPSLTLSLPPSWTRCCCCCCCCCETETDCCCEIEIECGSDCGD